MPRNGNGWAHHCCILLFEIQYSPSFVNRRNFDARQLAVPGQSKKFLIPRVLTSSIHHDYVDNRDVALSHQGPVRVPHDLGAGTLQNALTSGLSAKVRQLESRMTLVIECNKSC